MTAQVRIDTKLVQGYLDGLRFTIGRLDFLDYDYFLIKG